MQNWGFPCYKLFVVVETRPDVFSHWSFFSSVNWAGIFPSAFCLHWTTFGIFGGETFCATSCRGSWVYLDRAVWVHKDKPGWGLYMFLGPTCKHVCETEGLAWGCTYVNFIVFCSCVNTSRVGEQLCFRGHQTCTSWSPSQNRNASSAKKRISLRACFWDW